MLQAAHQNGATLDNLSDVVDLSEQQMLFVGDDPYAVNAWNSYFLAPGLKSAWVSLGFEIPEEETVEDTAEE